MSIYRKLHAIQQELKVPKSQYNSFGKYSYRSAEGILEAVKPLLEKHQVLLTLDDVVNHAGEGRFYIRAVAILTDLEDETQIRVSASARESDTKKGMDASQLTGTASSYARKYCLNGLFLLDDSKDADTNEFHVETSQSGLSALKKTVQTECAKRNISAEKWLAKSGKTLETATGQELTQMLATLKTLSDVA